jgi:ankyrin repeat protein
LEKLPQIKFGKLPQIVSMTCVTNMEDQFFAAFSKQKVTIIDNNYLPMQIEHKTIEEFMILIITDDDLSSFRLMCPYDAYSLSLCLEQALLFGSEKIIKFLLDNEVYFHHVENTITDKQNYLFYNCFSLIKKYPKILFRCLNIAILYDNPQIADFLHDKVDINMDESRIHQIVRINADVKIIDTYVHYGASINKLNKDNLTPIMLAIIMKRHSHVEKLLDKNCLISKQVLDLAHENDLPFPLIQKIRKMYYVNFNFIL